MIGPNNQAPPDTPLSSSVSVMRLGWQRMPRGNAYLAMASHAPENARKWCGRSWFMILIERVVVILNNIVGVFIDSHDGQPFWLIYPGWS
jgi:hypothetical protein